MDINGEQNLENEEVPSTEVVSRGRRGRKAEQAKLDGHAKDRGDWKYRPWNGRDHWVQDRTGASTFDLSKVK